jgi:hypothetical protein
MKLTINSPISEEIENKLCPHVVIKYEIYQNTRSGMLLNTV